MAAGTNTYLAGGDALAAMTAVADTKNVPVVIDALKNMVFSQPAQVTQTTQTTTPTTTTEQQPLIDTAEITQTTLSPAESGTMYATNEYGVLTTVPILGPEDFAEYPVIGKASSVQDKVNLYGDEFDTKPAEQKRQKLLYMRVILLVGLYRT